MVTLVTLDHRASRLCTRMETMNRAMILAVVCALVCPAIVLAQTAETKPVPINDVRKRSPTIVSSKGEFILRQDLFDPNNPINLRSDGPDQVVYRDQTTKDRQPAARTSPFDPGQPHESRTKDSDEEKPFLGAPLGRNISQFAKA